MRTSSSDAPAPDTSYRLWKVEAAIGTHENEIVRLSKKLDITGKRDVLIIFKEKRKESMLE